MVAADPGIEEVPGAVDGHPRGLATGAVARHLDTLPGGALVVADRDLRLSGETLRDVDRAVGADDRVAGPRAERVVLGTGVI